METLQQSEVVVSWPRKLTSAQLYDPVCVRGLRYFSFCWKVEDNGLGLWVWIYQLSILVESLPPGQERGNRRPNKNTPREGTLADFSHRYARVPVLLRLEIRSKEQSKGQRWPRHCPACSSSMSLTASLYTHAAEASANRADSLFVYLFAFGEAGSYSCSPSRLALSSHSSWRLKDLISLLC